MYHELGVKTGHNKKYFQGQGSAKGGPSRPNYRNNKNKSVFNKACNSCSWKCRVTSAPITAHVMVSLDHRKLQKQCTPWGCGPLKGAKSAQKAHQGSETKTRRLLGGAEENSVSTDEW